MFNLSKISYPDFRIKMPCRIVVLDNNVPQISLFYKPIIGDSVPGVARRDWDVSYSLGSNWKKAGKVKKRIVLCQSGRGNISGIVIKELSNYADISSSVQSGTGNRSFFLERNETDSTTGSTYL